MKTLKDRKKFAISKREGSMMIILLAIIICAILLVHHNPLAEPEEEWIKKIIACLITITGAAGFIFLYDKITVLPVELYQNRKLIWKLSVNDFKTRYAGSYLGMVWAVVQPIVTVVMYWLVFEFGLKQGSEMLKEGVTVPYVLYLTAGLVPWFYFSEAISNGTSSLLVYNYLVKKVVFKISILPIIKIIAATFIHLFFVGFLLILMMFYGYTPSIYWIQLIYYSGCMFLFVLGLSYATCAIVVFFRDLTQIIGIFLQVGMWATPILWQINRIPEQFQILFKINPLFYIVNGYRSALFEEQWFYSDFYSTMYFWIVTIVLFGIGAVIFKRLKVHFADVL